jgi:intraflagellar transport protein 122
MEMINKFYEHEKYACIYYAYNTVQKYLVSCFYKLLGVRIWCISILHGCCGFQDEPFTSYMPEALFNISRFLMNETKDVHPKGVSQFAILYSLAKQARNLGAYKLARQVLEKMQSLRVPPRFQVRYQEINFCTQIMLCSILQRSRAFTVVWNVFLHRHKSVT